MSKTYEHFREELSDEEWEEKYRREEDEYYRNLIEEMDLINLYDLDITDSSEEDLFRQIINDEREESMLRVWDKIEKELNDENRNPKKRD